MAKYCKKKSSKYSNFLKICKIFINISETSKKLHSFCYFLLNFDKIFGTLSRIEELGPLSCDAPSKSTRGTPWVDLLDPTEKIPKVAAEISQIQQRLIDLSQVRHTLCMHSDSMKRFI